MSLPLFEDDENSPTGVAQISNPISNLLCHGFPIRSVSGEFDALMEAGHLQAGSTAISD